VADSSAILAKLRDIDAGFSRLPSEAPLTETLQIIASRLVQLFEVDHSTITLLDERERYFRVMAECPTLSMPLVNERISIEGRTTQRDLLDRKEPVVANDLHGHALLTESSSFSEIVGRLDIKSMLIVPFVAEENTIGTFSLDAIGRARRFSAEDIRLCGTIANRLAASVSVSRLQEDQQKYRRQAGLLAPAPGRIRKLVGDEKIVDALFREVAKVIEFRKASLQFLAEGNRILMGAFGFDKSNFDPWLLRPVADDPIAWEICQSKRPKIIPETNSYQNWERQAGTNDVGVV